MVVNLSREMNHSFKACDWLLITDVTLSCARAPLTQDQEKVDDQLHGTNKVGLDWFGLVLSTQN